jgi:membrane-bound metal-dependent hydrolase YbcI (DUF457 family)
VFIGHFAVGFASRRATPAPSLGWLVAAPLFLDLIWPIFVLLGWERVRVEPGNTRFTPLAFEYYPWSHSLAMAVVWGLVLGGLYWTRRRDRAGAAVIGGLVVSHWVLDWITHRPDLPLWPGGELRVGLGLWNAPAATFIIESLLFAGGVWLYASGTTARDRAGRWGWIALVVTVSAIYVMNVLSPPPPSPQAVASVTLAMWLFPVWAWWADRHRAAIAPPDPGFAP